MTREQLEALKRWVEAAIELQIIAHADDRYTFTTRELERRYSKELDALFQEDEQP